MGILNITPDSFFDGGMHNQTAAALSRCEQMLREGADIIDVGAFSSRPGAEAIDAAEEIDRYRPVLKALVKEFPKAIVSVDTFRAEVARFAVNEGAHIINDISGGTLDEQMFATVAELQVPYILMHMRGTPATMQSLTHYKDLPGDLIRFFAEAVSRLRGLGLHDIIVDPGFGFAKTLPQNYELLSRMQELQILNLPILAGISRKSMIYKLLNTSAVEALNGTSVLNLVALQQGASVLRVHDVHAASEVVMLYAELEPAQSEQ